MTDEQLKTLVIAARAGRQAALDRFASLTQDRVFRFAFAQLQDQQLAADATQETFVRMLSQLIRNALHMALKDVYEEAGQRDKAAGQMAKLTRENDD